MALKKIIIELTLETERNDKLLGYLYKNGTKGTTVRTHGQEPIDVKVTVFDSDDVIACPNCKGAGHV